AAPVTLNAMQQFKVTGTTAQVTPISPSQVGQINAGLEGKGIQHKEAANQEQVKTQVAQATNAVLGALLGGSGGGALVGGGWPVIILPPPPPPPPPPTPYKQNQLTTETVAGAAIVRPQLTIPGNAFQVETDPPNITINPALAQFAAALAAAPIPVVMIPAGGVSTGPVPANLDRPLFQATGSDITIGGNLLNVLGSLSSTSSLPVLSTERTTITTGGDFIRIAPGASVSVKSSLVSDT